MPGCPALIVLLCFGFEIDSPWVAKVALEITILLHPPAESWDDRCVTPHAAVADQGEIFRAG